MTSLSRTRKAAATEVDLMIPITTSYLDKRQSIDSEYTALPPGPAGGLGHESSLALRGWLNRCPGAESPFLSTAGTPPST
jgi:hypothetical protein